MRRGPRTREAQVQGGRVDRHPVVLQLRVQASSVFGGESHPLERTHVREEQDHQEECEDPQQRPAHIGHELPVAGAVDEHRDRSEDREQQRPEDEGAALSGPEAGDLEVGVEFAVRVVGDVAVLVAVPHEGGDDPERGEQDQQRQHMDGALTAQDQFAAPEPAPYERYDRTPKGRREERSTGRFRPGSSRREVLLGGPRSGCRTS